MAGLFIRQRNDPMKILIIGGFLGSGKTTVLIQMAEHLIRKSRGENPSIQYPVVILENEVSGTGIDNRLLSRSGFKVRELLSGCICCSSSAQLSEAVYSIEKEYSPEWLLIEATGMAYPDAIWETLQEEFQADAKILALLDAARWIRFEKAMLQFARAQMAKADVILVNKIDLVTRRQLLQIQESLNRLHTSAHVREVSMMQLPGPEFWEKMIEELEAGYV